MTKNTMNTRRPMPTSGKWRPGAALNVVATRRTVIGFCTAVTLLVAALVSRAAFAETLYWRLVTERITVVSNGSGKRCAKVAAQVMTFERVLRDLGDLDDESQWRPLVVYVLSDKDAHRVFLSEADKRQQDASNTRIYSKYLPGRDSNVAAIVDVDGIDEPLQSVLLLYSQSLLMSGQARSFPPWYQFGVSNITNGLLIREDGSVLLNRDGPFEPQADKNVRTKYDLATLLATTASDLSSGGGWRPYTRRAREWAQFGLLTTPERRSHYRELAALMRQGTPAEDAVSQTFGLPLSELSKEFDDGRWKRQAEFKVAAPAVKLELPAAERLDDAQANGLLQVISERVAQQAPRS